VAASAVPAEQVCSQQVRDGIRAAVGAAYLPVRVSINRTGRATVVSNNPMAQTLVSSLTFPRTPCVATVQ
jgi:hypothetical protein